MVRDIGFCVGLPLAILALAVVPAQAQVHFRLVMVGQYAQPVALAEGAPDVFYSTGDGAAFSVTARGKATTLAAFPNGYNPSLMVSASNERFYGSVYVSGPSVLNIFSVSSKPNSLISYAQQTLLTELIQNLPDGNLLGVGYDSSTGGTAYLIKADLDGNVTPLYQFPAGEQLPNNAIYAMDGNYYGVSWQRYIGDGTAGYIYRLTQSGVLTKLYTYPSGTFYGRGSNFVPILQGTDANLYGVTTAGGANGYGSVYQLTLSGQYTTLYSFTKGPSSYPQSLIQASDGNFYAASLGYSYTGQISRITPLGEYTELHEMTDNSGCQCLIIQGSDGVIYGTAIDNSIFALNVGLPKPAPQALEFGPQHGPAGTRVRIWGYNLLGAAVAFNGVAAVAVSNSGANYVWATVPNGAATGPITITTPGGTSTTAASFKVE